MLVLELRERASEEAQLARDIKDKADAESRGLTADEVEEFNKHLNESDRLEREADMQERLESTEARLNKPEARKVPGEISDGSRIEVVGPKMYRYGHLLAFKGANAQRDAYRSGRFLAATLFNHAVSRQYCHDHGIELRIDTEVDIHKSPMKSL